MFVGREYELSLIGRHLQDDSKAQLIVLYGRRRIGKSTLIAKALEHESRALFFEGIEGARSQANKQEHPDVGNSGHPIS